LTQDEILTLAESAELVVSKHSVWTPEKQDFTYMGHTVEGDLANLMQFAELVAARERKAWINLTSAEIGEIYRVGWAANMELARAIEAKLKEKNE
jgi:hypothetical protein